MDFEKMSQIEFETNKYIILSVLKEENIAYAFSNKLDIHGNPSEEYIILKKENDNITMLNNQNLINKLLLQFQKNIKKDMNDLLNEGENL